MEKINICRPITFYNHFVPAAKKQRHWEYCAFGAYDGVEVHSGICKERASDILVEILSHQNMFSQRLNGKYTAQTVYAICYDNEQNESAFWGEDDEKPFTFFCRMQFKNNIDLLRNKEQLSRHLQENGEIASMLYASYDNSDLIIVIKACLYSEGAKLINSLHQGFDFSFASGGPCELRNSFTVFAVKRDFVNSMANETKRQQLNTKEKIDLASIRIIERDCGKMREFSETLRGRLKKEKIKFDEIQPILGIDDEILFLKEIGWGDFLHLYHGKKGAFGSDYIAGTTTTICINIQAAAFDIEEKKTEEAAAPDIEGKKTEEATAEKNPLEIPEIYQGYVDSIYQKIGKISKENVKYKELNTILNILPKFSGGIFSDYVFFPLLKPLSMLADLLQKGNDDCYYEFIKMFSAYAQNSTKSDRHSMQTMDFNAKLYDIPAKLNAFYTTLIYRASEILNIAEEGETPHTYEFFVIPGFTNIVSLTELHHKVSVDKRLICVEVPESSFYNISESMVIFMHEAAHYVGTFLRNREQRYNCFLQSIASAYIEYIKSFWLDEQYETGIEVSDAEWEALKKRMEKMLWEMLEREKNIEYLREYQIGKDNNSEVQAENIRENNNTYQWHFSFLKQNLYRTLTDIVQLALPNVFGGIVFGLPPARQSDIYEFIREISEKFLTRYTEPSTKTLADTVLEELIDIYEESFADLMSILILKLTGKEYLDCVVNNGARQDADVEILKMTSALYRTMLVCDVMVQTQGKEWIENCLDEDDNKEKRNDWLSGIWEIRKLIKDGMKGDVLIHKYRKNYFYALLDKGVYKCALNYLKECRERFETKCTEGYRAKLCNELSEFYWQEKAEKNNIESQLGNIKKFISSYKHKMLEELRRSSTK